MPIQRGEGIGLTTVYRTLQSMAAAGQQLFTQLGCITCHRGDTGARGATTTFVQRGMGDVLLAWENEAILAVQELGKDQFEIVAPSLSILAEPPVTVVDKFVDKHGTRKVAEAYLQYLYSPEGQEIAAKNYYRPRDPKVAAKYDKQFAPVKLVTIDEVFGGWRNAQKTHFDDGGVFDQINLAR